MLIGCATRPPLPPLPDIDTSRFLPAVRKPVEKALADLKARPHDPAANGRLGIVLHAHNQFSAARVCYQRAAILEPDRFDWFYYLGAAQLADGRSAEAVSTLQRAVALRPKWLPAELKLIQALIDSGQPKAALDLLTNVKGRHPQDATVNFLYGRVTQSRGGVAGYYEQALAAFPQYGAAMFALAQQYQRTGRGEDAKRLMGQYPQFKNTSPPVDDPLMSAVTALRSGPTELLRQAASLAAQGQLAQAAQLNEKALELDPALTQAHTNLISTYARLGYAVKAEGHYKAAVGQNPNAAEAYYNFGVLCYSTNRKSDAEAAFEKTVAIDPGNADAHANLGSLLQEQGKLREAASAIRKALDLKPDNRIARFNLARIYANERRYKEALAEFSQIVTAEDDSTPTYLYAMGATYARAGRRDDAIATLGRAKAKALERGQAPVAAMIDRDLARLAK